MRFFPLLKILGIFAYDNECSDLNGKNLGQFLILRELKIHTGSNGEF